MTQLKAKLAEKIQAHVRVWISVGAHDPGICGFDLDAEFFVQLARERHQQRLSRLDFAAWKFPVTGVHLVRRALRQKEAAVRPLDHRGDDLDQSGIQTRLLRGAPAARRRPDTSRANCQATRPERDPRDSAHCSASSCVAAISRGEQPNSASQCSTMPR